MREFKPSIPECPDDLKKVRSKDGTIYVRRENNRWACLMNQFAFLVEYSWEDLVRDVSPLVEVIDPPTPGDFLPATGFGTCLSDDDLRNHHSTAWIRIEKLIERVKEANDQ